MSNLYEKFDEKGKVDTDSNLVLREIASAENFIYKKNSMNAFYLSAQIVLEKLMILIIFILPSYEVLRYFFLKGSKLNKFLFNRFLFTKKGFSNESNELFIKNRLIKMGGKATIY